MGLIETYRNLSAYDSFDVAAYKLEQQEALECIQALEKQIPKKARIEAAGERTISGYCPRCEAEQVYIMPKSQVKLTSWCRNCGQKIDWS